MKPYPPNRLTQIKSWQLILIGRYKSIQRALDDQFGDAFLSLMNSGISHRRFLKIVKALEATWPN